MSEIYEETTKNLLVGLFTPGTRYDSLCCSSTNAGVNVGPYILNTQPPPCICSNTPLIGTSPSGFIIRQGILRPASRDGISMWVPSSIIGAGRAVCPASLISRYLAAPTSYHLAPVEVILITSLLNCFVTSGTASNRKAEISRVRSLWSMVDSRNNVLFCKDGHLVF